MYAKYISQKGIRMENYVLVVDGLLLWLNYQLDKYLIIMNYQIGIYLNVKNKNLQMNGMVIHQKM